MPMSASPSFKQRKKIEQARNRLLYFLLSRVFFDQPTKTEQVLVMVSRPTMRALMMPAM